MKTVYKLIFLILLMQFSFKVISQNFISENKMWSILISLFDSYGNINSHNTYYYKFSGDTIINDQSLKKLYVTSDRGQKTWWFNSVWKERNDSVFAGVYSWNNYELELLYDFNVHEGDSFILEAYSSDTIFLLIDSVRYKPWGGEIRKHIYSHSRFYDIWPETVWIEGVGNIGNPTRSSEAGYTGTWHSLLCFEEEGNLVYQDPEYNTCYVNTTSAQVIPKNEDFVGIYATGEGSLHIELLQHNTGSLHLYTPDGKQILKCPLTKPETILCAPGAGLFLYRFVTEEGGVQSGKVVVK